MAKDREQKETLEPVPVEKIPAEQWEREHFPSKATYVEADVNRWDAILKARTAKYQPDCKVDPAYAFNIIDRPGTIVEFYKSELGEIGACFLAKPGGKKRLAYLLGDVEDEDAIADVLLRGLLEKFADKETTAVYWYTDDAFGKTAEGRVFQEIAKRLDKVAAENGLQTSFRGDNANLWWEVTRG